mmetsp:Transcript_18141/g.36560  ORF Transcript_18141/g.36560 Transcript_18141/m.36560 type:complete len:240 (+) Transcript_18141:86-805(+)
MSLFMFMPMSKSVRKSKSMNFPQSIPGTGALTAAPPPSNITPLRAVRATPPSPPPAGSPNLIVPRTHFPPRRHGTCFEFLIVLAAQTGIARRRKSNGRGASFQIPFLFAESFYFGGVAVTVVAGATGVAAVAAGVTVVVAGIPLAAVAVVVVVVGVVALVVVVFIAVVIVFVEKKTRDAILFGLTVTVRKAVVSRSRTSVRGRWRTIGTGSDGGSRPSADGKGCAIDGGGGSGRGWGRR